MRMNMQAKKIWGWIALLVAVFLLYGITGTSLAAESKTDLNAFMQETQKMSQKADEMVMVWWIPEEFWRISFAQNPTMTEAQVEEFIKVLRQYTLVVAVEGKVGAFGGITYKSEADIRADIRIKDNERNYYRPLGENKVDADTMNFLSMMKPVFANMLGPMGQNMHFILFPSKSKRGKNIANAKKEGVFYIELGKREFRWRLPLGSLLPPKTCPTCGEKLSGAYKFCPWDGTKLR